MAKDQHAEKELPEGTPPDEPGKDADKEKLILGKYKTMEEAEKGEKEREKKFTQAHQELGDAKRELEIERQKTQLIDEKQEEIRKAKTEEEKKRLEQDLEQMGITFAEESKKGPAAMMRALHRMFDAYVSGQGFVKRDELRHQSEAERRQTETFNRIRAAHKEDFDKLAPKMAEIWAKLPPSAKVPETLETVYLAAKAEMFPDEGKLKEKIISDMRAGHGEGGGEKPPLAGEKSDVDKIIEEHKKTKIM